MSDDVCPVVHRVFAGVLTHHYLREDGTLAQQFRALDPAAGQRRLGYRVLVDESTGTVFADFHFETPGQPPTLPLVPLLLALAWCAPMRGACPRRPTGPPDILQLPEGLLATVGMRKLTALGKELGFVVEHPEEQPDTAQFHTRLEKVLDDIRTFGPKARMDLPGQGLLGRLSFAVSRGLAAHLPGLRAADHLAALRDHGRPPRYQHRRLSPQWLRSVATSHELSMPEFMELGFPYFVQTEETFA